MDKKEFDNNIKVVKDMLKNNKKRALSVAVAITVGSLFTSCSNLNVPEDSTYLVGDSSRDFSQSSPAEPTGYTNSSGSARGFYYFGGGSYFYGRGATYRQGSWGSSPKSSFSKGGFSGSSTSGIGG